MVNNVLAGLLDDKLIRVITLFTKHPDKRFYLSEIARMSDVNTATTFRIMSKIVAQDLVKATVIGKARTYQLSKNEKANNLSGMLRRDDSDVLDDFCERIAMFPRVRLVLLDSKTGSDAKLIIVGEFPSKERIERVAADIMSERKYKISFVEFNIQQYKDMKELGMLKDKKIIYRKT